MRKVVLSSISSSATKIWYQGRMTTSDKFDISYSLDEKIGWNMDLDFILLML
jgi:hypothetical protein